MDTNKLVLGVLAGAAVGALAGILFAPEKGSVTRRNIVHKGEDYLADIKDKFQEFLDTSTRKLESIQKETEENIVKGKAKYEDVKKDFKNATV